MNLLHTIARWLFQPQYKECQERQDRKCTYGYTFDRNGALYVYGDMSECCRVQRQIKAAAKLATKRGE